MSEPIPMWEFTRSHPDCDHCKTILQSMTPYPRSVHESCPCICHGPIRDWYANGGKRKRVRN